MTHYRARATPAGLFATDAFSLLVIIDAVYDSKSRMASSNACGHYCNVVIESAPVSPFHKGISIGKASLINAFPEKGCFDDLYGALISIHHKHGLLFGDPGDR